MIDYNLHMYYRGIAIRVFFSTKFDLDDTKV